VAGIDAGLFFGLPASGVGFPERARPDRLEDKREIESQKDWRSDE